MSKKVKRTETLSIRINPHIKAGLAAAANYSDTTMSTVIEHALQAGIDQAIIPADEINKDFRRIYCNDGPGPLGRIIKYAWHDNPVLMSIRLYYLFPKALGERDRIIYSTVLITDMFAGGDNIFFDTPSLAEFAPSVDLAKIHTFYDKLVGFAEFRIHELQRPHGSIVVNFLTYLELSLKGDRKGKSDGGATFVLRRTKQDQYYFTLVKANGLVILTSQMYGSKASALSGIEAVKRNAQRKEAFNVRQGSDAGYQFIIKAPTGEIVGVSENYGSREAIDQVISDIREWAPDSSINETV